MSLGHVYIVLEPVGSARLMFGDDRYYEFMCFDVLKVVQSPGYDHGHDEESRNGRDVKIHILDDMVRPRGQAHEAFRSMQKGVLRRPGGQTPETLASGPGPDADAHGVWVRRQGLWRLVLESEWDSCLSGKTDFEEAFAPT